MSALTLTMTNAGQAAFTAAQAGGPGVALQIAKVGFTDQAFVVAPTLTALPGELRRVDTLSGAAVGDNTIHMVVRDEAAGVAYGARGFGLFLANGTLFAVYGQAERIVEKSAASTLLLAIDVAFPTPAINNLTFGAANFLDPPATTETAGVVELATVVEATVGTDTQRAVTAAGVRAVLKALGLSTFAPLTGGGKIGDGLELRLQLATTTEAENGAILDKVLTPGSINGLVGRLNDKVSGARLIKTIGAIAGGRSLGEDITLDVPIATVAEVAAGGDRYKVLTPGTLSAACAATGADNSVLMPGGRIEKIGSLQTTLALGAYDVVFAQPFPNRCLYVAPVARNLGAPDRAGFVQIKSRSVTGFTFVVQGPAGAMLDGIDWLAKGD